ncbi:MAG: HEAT repeat domain-containing protein [Verrucomicrobia subdivision 3 bacterium]|nr:HEAT repeat domain-containing protein [Limisphaerales bacterium]
MKSFWTLALLVLNAAPAVGAPALTLEKDDHIAIIGNGLADRMQHSGYFETLLHTKLPQHQLVVRNLGFAGDELVTRSRSEAFGPPDEWLKHTGATVVFAFFGYNESFRGQDGLEKFRKDVEKFIKETASADYSGKGAPRLVLFSPTAAERHSDPNFPNADELNHQIKYYVDAMEEIAKANNVPFVDLFSVSQQAYAQAKEPLTINAVHLRDDGYRALAPGMFRQLFGEPPATRGRAFEKLRAAVNEKNAVWFSRYRTVDGYNVYGGRSHLKFDGIKNRDAMQREMEMRDVMTANRDKRVWAVAQGGDLAVKDDNLPAPVEVKSNKPGRQSDGSHVFLSGEAAIKRMQMPPGCKANLFASEEEFPLLANPVQMAFDTKGRLWVAAWPNYPERLPQSKQGDSLLVFEDTNNDGKADKCTPFIDDLNCPTGFQFYKDGVILVQAPDVWFVRDTDGDGKADWKERILNGLDSADSHHTANSLVLEPGGAIYLSDGVFHRTQAETAWGPPVRNNDGAIFRFEPRTLKFETYISYGFANPHGRVFDHWGNDLVTDATGNNTYFGPAFSGHLDYPAKHSSLKQFWERPSRPCPGTGILSSRHFPEEFQGNFLNCNVIGFQGIYRVKVKEEGSGLWGETLEPPLVQSDDPNFRPSAVDVAPDGSVYFLDWHNPIIGHMQHHIRDPNRDHQHGRIYRITYEGRELPKPPKVAGQSIDKLLDLLKEPENNVRTRARIELGGRDTKQVIAAVQKWAKQFGPKKIQDQHHFAEALWVHQHHNVINEPLLEQMLQSPEPRARAAAVRVLCYWRDRVSQPLARLRAAANDNSPRVRLEAVRAASFFETAEAMEIAYEILKYDTDYYLDYTFNETTRQLKKHIKGFFLPKDPKAFAAALPRFSDKELLDAPNSEPVLLARLERKSYDVNTRGAAIEELAKLRKTDRVTETVAALRRVEASKGPANVASDFALLLTANPGSLANARQEIAELSRSASHAPVKRAAYATLVASDGGPERAWNDTRTDSSARVTLIDSIILLTDPEMRAKFQPWLTAALKDVSASGDVRRAVLRALPLMGADHAAENFALLAGYLREGRELSATAGAVLQLPRDTWDKEAAGPVAEAILAWAQSVPSGERSSQEFIETVQAGTEMTTLLPQPEALRIRKALNGLGVRVFAIKSVREQMRFDVTRIVVEAGKPFEIIFENVDMMPHNIVIVEPGAREEVGTAADKMQPTPDKEGRAYIPKSKKIIAASKLVEPGDKVRLKVAAPERPGVYEYVCTYPEHWKVMFGQLVVVKDLDAFLETDSGAVPKAAAAAGHAHQH